MDQKEFIEKFAEVVEIENASACTAETEFRKLDEWSSLAALSVIAMIDEEYDIQVKGDEMRSCATVGELFNLVNSKA